MTKHRETNNDNSNLRSSKYGLRSGLSFQKKIVFFFVLVILVLASIFYAVQKNNRHLDDTANQVQHTNDVLLENQRLLNLTRDLEMGTTRYLISGNEAFLSPFHTAQPLVFSSLVKLKELTRDNAGQQVRIDTVRQLLDSNIAVRKQIIEIRRTQGASAANAIFSTGITRDLMYRLRAVIERIEYAEEQLLIQRKENNRQIIERSAITINIFGVLIVVLLLIALIVIYNNSRARNEAEKQIRQLNETLEARIAAKTQEVLEKEKQYRFLLENMREGIQVIGYDWRYLFVNSSVVSQGKYTNEELLGHTMMEKYPGIENTELFRVLETCMADRVARVFENEFVFPDGTIEWFELSIQPVPEGLFILSMDVTERKKSEKSLKESEENFRTLIEVSPDAIFISQNSQIIYLNQAGYNLFSIDRPEQIIGKNALDFFHPDYHEVIKQRRVALLGSGEKAPLLEEKIITAKGEVIDVEVAAARFNHKNGEALQVVLRDITDRKKVEQELLRLNESLEKRAGELWESNQELERFAYVASHDLQEPLRMVSSFLHLLEKKLEGTLDEGSKKYIYFAVDGAERMKKLIQDLLGYSRVSNNRVAPTNVDCNEVLKAVIYLYDLKIRELQATINVADLPTITGVYPQIQQLFQNLIGNALKYHGAERPVIDIGCKESETMWEFYVRDNGIGIDPRFFHKIFIIFQRLHNKTEYSGTGIGLAICKKIVERHNGSICVDSEPGRGSTFYFTIPKTK